MIQLPGGDRTNGMQKIFAVILMAAAAFGIMWVANTYIFPNLIWFLKNLWITVLLGAPLTLVTLYIVTNPLMVWGFFKTLSWKFTSWLIKMDPLSVMDRYVDYLRKKLTNLMGTVQILQGKKTKLDRRVKELEASVQNNLKLGAAAMKTGNTQRASIYGVKVQTDNNTLKMLQPLQRRIDKNLGFLQALGENWTYGIEKLQYQIEGKRAEYEIIKETTRGLKSAEDFINSDNEAARIYGQSLKALEETVTQQIGYIDEFERRSKDIMSSINIEKQAIQDDGLKELEKYIQGGTLTMPDFSRMGGITDLAYEAVPANQNGKPGKFNLLNK